MFAAVKYLFDREFNETMSSLKVLPRFSTKLSSAGLVYAHYGRRILAAILNIPEESASLDILFEKVYEGLIEELDAGDNGISPCDGIPKYFPSI